MSNLCVLSGKVVPAETQIPYWLYPSESVVHVNCPMCDKLVSVNRTSKKFRKHSVGERKDLQFIQSFE